MKSTLYALAAAFLLLSACDKDKDNYSVHNPGSTSVHVRFYASEEDYFADTNLLYSTIVAPDETLEIPMSNFPRGTQIYRECFTSDFKYATWPDKPKAAFIRSAKGSSSGSSADNLTFFEFDSGRPAPSVFIKDNPGSLWKAISKNGDPVSGDAYTMTVRKDLTVTFDYDTTHIETTYWFYTDAYQIGIFAPGILIHANEHFSIIQGVSGNPVHTPWIYDSPSAGSDTVVVLYNGDELLYKRVNYL